MRKVTRFTAVSSFALASLILWSACSKSKSTDNGGLTARTKVVTTGSWKYDTAGIDIDRNGTIDVGDNSLDACFRDNIFTFSTDSTGVVDEGATKCDASDPQTYTFTWSFTSSDQGKIKSDADPLLEDGINIYNVTDSKFILYKDTTYLSQKLWYIVQLKH